ncbi:MAG: FAD-dependent oxidoreductase, partial [Pseudomonadota bacterium]
MVKIAILGGGVAGLSAAHELAERSGDGVEFEIHVYEKRTDFVGGKARSTPVFTRAPKKRGPSAVSGPVGEALVGEPATEWVKDGAQALPGEHGFRFFPGFYRHLPDTMKRIPTPTGESAFDNLVVAKNLLLARFGAKNFEMPTGVPTDFGGFLNAIKDMFADRHADLGLTPFQLETFASKLWRILTSCDDRRLAELEDVTWWDYLQAGEEGLKGAYEAFLAEGLSRSLLANNPRIASARTVGNTNIQLIYDVVDTHRDADRILNGPTSLAWLTPWREYLTKTRDGVKVSLHTGAEVTAIAMDGDRVSGATVEIDGKTETVEADVYVAALPVERMAEIVEASPALPAADPKLGEIPGLAESVGMMYGVQFYLTRDVPIVEGHALYVDSPWALTSISEVQFWKEHFDISKSDDGKARGLVSVCVSEWAAEGIDGAPPAEDSPSRAALVAQVWDQLKAALNHDGEEVLKDEDLHAWYLDEDVNFLPEARQVNRGREPLFINRTGDWRRRPDAATKIPNFFLASDYVRTYTDVACMEAANEAARRAVNAILTATGSKAEPCELWPLTEPAFFAPFKKADQIRFDRGLPWIGKDEPELPLYPPPTAKYVDRVPNIVHRQPFICRDVQMFGYFLEGDQAA